MTNNFFEKIEEILDLSYELCEHDDAEVSKAAVKINNQIYDLKKEQSNTQRDISNSIYKLSKRKTLKIEDIKNILESNGIKV
tara:strand:+ start:6000 stop:6245 length:246 start_codon:yes stop_codon:yes gene_type:complete